MGTDSDLRPSQQPVGYLTKELDIMVGWPACLQDTSAVVLLIPEIIKLTLGNDLTVLSPHNMTGLLTSNGSLWLSDSHILSYQAILLEGLVIQIKKCPPSPIQPLSSLRNKEK